jgi:hypothetical protein
MASTPKRLHGPAQLSGTTATKYTVPAVTKTIVRHIHIQNPSGSPVTLTMSVGADAAGVRLFDAYSIPANSTYDWWTYVVLEAAEIIAAHAGTASVLVIVIDGDEKTLG